MFIDMSEENVPITITITGDHNDSNVVLSSTDAAIHGNCAADEHGDVGPTGPPGPAGPVGPAGPAGSDADVALLEKLILQTNHNISTKQPQYNIIASKQQYCYPEIDKYLSKHVPGCGWLKTTPAYQDASKYMDVTTIKAGTFFSGLPGIPITIIDKHNKPHIIEPFKAVRYDIELPEDTPINLVGEVEDNFAVVDPPLGITFVPRLNPIDIVLSNHETIKYGENCPFYLVIICLIYNLFNYSENVPPEVKELIPGGQFSKEFCACPDMLDFHKNMCKYFTYEVECGYSAISDMLPMAYTYTWKTPLGLHAGLPSEDLITYKEQQHPLLDGSSVFITPQILANEINSILQNAERINNAAGNMNGSLCPVSYWLLILLMTHGTACLILDRKITYERQGTIVNGLNWGEDVDPVFVTVTQDLKDRLNTSTENYDEFVVGQEVDLITFMMTWPYDLSTKSLFAYWWVDTIATNPGSLASFPTLAGNKMIEILNNLLDESLAVLPSY